MEKFEAGQKIFCPEEGEMKVVEWDFFSNGEPILCLASEEFIYPAFQFDPRDWTVIEK